MITLIHAPHSRSASFVWLLEEIGEPYEVRHVDIRRGDGSGRMDPANPHPHGKVPVIDDDGVIVFEQSAIALYLVDRFPKSGLGPAVGESGRGLFLTMMAYYSGVVEPAFTSKFLGQAVPRGTAGWVDSDEVMDFVNASLAKRAYIAGDAFTAADVLYAGAFSLFQGSPLLAGKRTQQLDDYVARCVSRPARARAAAKDLQPG